jgi:DNA polymerase III delta subunit
MLIQAKEGAPLKGAPFMINKIKKQAERFSLDQLLKLHNAVYQLDGKIKNSELLLEVGAELDLLVINM